METPSKDLQFETRCIHAGQTPDPTTGAVMTPIYQTSTFVQTSPGEHQGYDYSRADNPTRKAYEDCIAALEYARYGLAFSSGVAAIDTIVRLLKSGDEILSCDDVYGGTYRLFEQIYQKFGVVTRFVDFSNPDQVKEALNERTRLVWIETPTNPLLKIIDIQAAAEMAKKHGALCAVDNTFASPFFQNPLLLGADIVMHSVTKYMNGHSDVIGGVVATQNQSLFEEMKFIQKSVGAVPSPMDCFLVLRGLKTLPIRMQRHQENALKLAQFLSSHEQVERVVYPGLESHPNHTLAKKQMSGFSGMITFFLKGGLEASRKLLETVQVFALAESLGGVESLIEHPAIMTHASVPKAIREKTGISDNLIRLSVGIEGYEDLKNDLDFALKRSAVN